MLVHIESNQFRGFGDLIRVLPGCLPLEFSRHVPLADPGTDSELTRGIKHPGETPQERWGLTGDGDV